jgi:hypothetical protein
MKNHNQRGFVGLSLIIGLVFIVVIGAAFIYVSKHNSSSTITNDGYTYSFNFQNSKTISISGRQYLQSNDGTFAVSAKSSTADSDCTSNVLEQAMIDGSSHAICIDKNSSVYTANFIDNGNWHNVTILSSNLTQSLDKNTAIQILTSIKVN